MNLVFFGSGKYGLTVLKNLDSTLIPSLILTTDKQDSDPVASFASGKIIEHKKVSNLTNRQIIEQFKNLKPTVGILANFGLYVPKEIIDSFELGILNIHPSLLPKYRGPTPGQTAILNGVTKTGVTIIKMDDKIDHGPIVLMEEEIILKEDTAETLYLKLFKKGTIKLNNIFEQFIDRKINLEKQNDSQATYTKQLQRENGHIDVLKDGDIEIISRMIKAFNPWPGVWLKAKLSNEDEKVIKLLPENKIQVEGKTPMSHKDFINGYPNAPKELKELLKKLSSLN